MIFSGSNLCEWLGSVSDRLRGRLIFDAPLAPLTWLRAGGNAEVLFQPADEDDLIEFLGLLPAEVPVMAIGLGSNLLVRDGGVEGVVIRLSAKGFGLIERLDDGLIRAGCAVPDKKLSSSALEAGLGGFAFYHGIPGCVGGALRMNAGAHGSETQQVLVEARAVDRSGSVHVVPAEDMGFVYRGCGIPPDWIFTSALFRGTSEATEAIQERIEKVVEHRESSQPIREKTSGSTFRNPDGHSAWKLIASAGLSGASFGSARMSEMHCNFMINEGEATGFDLESLGERVRVGVREDSGILLEWEVKRIGRFESGREVIPAESA